MNSYSSGWHRVDALIDDGFSNARLPSPWNVGLVIEVIPRVLLWFSSFWSQENCEQSHVMQHAFINEKTPTDESKLQKLLIADDSN